jgi:hypothetical protein
MTPCLPAQKKGPGLHRSLLPWILIFLQRPDVLGLQTLRTFRHLELHALTFLQAAETAGLDRGEVHENVLATLAADKPITLGIIEPLHCSLFHICLVEIPFGELR